MAFVKFVFMSDVVARTKRDKKGAPYAMEELIISHLSNRPQFLWVYQGNKPSGEVGRTLEKLVNSWPPARDLQAFRVFFQHHGWGSYPDKPYKMQPIAFIKRL